MIQIYHTSLKKKEHSRLYSLTTLLYVQFGLVPSISPQNWQTVDDSEHWKVGRRWRVPFVVVGRFFGGWFVTCLLLLLLLFSCFGVLWMSDIGMWAFILAKFFAIGERTLDCEIYLIIIIMYICRETQWMTPSLVS